MSLYSNGSNRYCTKRSGSRPSARVVKGAVCKPRNLEPKKSKTRNEKFEISRPISRNIEISKTKK